MDATKRRKWGKGTKEGKVKTRTLSEKRKYDDENDEELPTPWKGNNDDSDSGTEEIKRYVELELEMERIKKYFDCKSISLNQFKINGNMKVTKKEKVKARPPPEKRQYDNENDEELLILWKVRTEDTDSLIEKIKKYIELENAIKKLEEMKKNLRKDQSEIEKRKVTKKEKVKAPTPTEKRQYDDEKDEELLTLWKVQNVGSDSLSDKVMKHHELANEKLKGKEINLRKAQFEIDRKGKVTKKEKVEAPTLTEKGQYDDEKYNELAMLWKVKIKDSYSLSDEVMKYYLLFNEKLRIKKINLRKAKFEVDTKEKVTNKEKVKARLLPGKRQYDDKIDEELLKPSKVTIKDSDSLLEKVVKLCKLENEKWKIEELKNNRRKDHSKMEKRKVTKKEKVKAPTSTEKYQYDEELLILTSVRNEDTDSGTEEIKKYIELENKKRIRRN